MGFLGSVLGTTSDYKATGATGDASVVSPINKDQALAANTNVNQGLDQQQQFLAALQAQNGIGNQSQVFNQLQGVANGTGPNPAQAMLNQSTGANVANQAALMAGQRGAGANTGLLARQAAMQGANIQQQAAGQGATLQANQSLGALGQLGNMAGQQVAQQTGALNAYNQYAQGNQNALFNQINAQNSANVQNSLGTQNINSDTAKANASSNAGLVGGLIGGAGAALMAATGGEVSSQQIGNNPVMANSSNQVASLKEGGPRSKIGRHFKSMPQMMAQGGPVVPGKADVHGDSLKNDKVKALLSPGEIVLPRSVTQSKDPVSAAAKFVQAIMAKKGLK